MLGKGRQVMGVMVGRAGGNTTGVTTGQVL